MNEPELHVCGMGFEQDNDELGYGVFVLYNLMGELDCPIVCETRHQYSFHDQYFSSFSSYSSFVDTREVSDLRSH